MTTWTDYEVGQMVEEIRTLKARPTVTIIDQTVTETAVTVDVDSLKAENEALKAENATLRAHNEALEVQNQALKEGFVSCTARGISSDIPPSIAPAKASKGPNLCKACGAVIPPTGKRGRPAVLCPDCKAKGAA